MIPAWDPWQWALYVLVAMLVIDALVVVAFAWVHDERERHLAERKKVTDETLGDELTALERDLPGARLDRNLRDREVV